MKKPPPKKVVRQSPSALDLIPERPLLEQALGGLVMRLSFVHFILEINLWSLLGIDSKCGRVLTEDLPLSSLASRFRRTVEAKNPQPDALKKLKKTLSDLEKINAERNKLVHGFWTFPKDGPALIVAKKGQVISKNAPTYSDIRDLIDQTDSFVKAFFDCMFQIYNPSLDQLRSRPEQISS